MPAFGNIVINDGATTPVAHTFAPRTIDAKGVAFHDDRAGGVSIGYPTISISSVAPTATSKMYKVRAKVTLPVLENVTGSTSSGFTPAPTLAYTLTANLEFITPARCSQQNRKDLLAFVKNLLSHATMTSVVADNDAIY